MKTYFLLINILLLCFLTGCETESVSSIQEPMAGNILSRSNDTEPLPTGSNIMLNAIGGLTIENRTFTFDGTTWNDGNEYKWENIQTPTYITALYPWAEQYTSATLYNESKLKDILIAQDTLVQGKTDVTLTFKHLFASFTLKVEESLADKIESVQLVSAQSIESISTTTGEIKLSDTRTSTTLTGDGSNSYIFIIPPMEETSLHLNITLNDNSSMYSYELESHTFKSGVKYECTLRDGETTPGIRTAEDLIAFSQYINKGEDAYAYGEMQPDGRMLYRLLADIDLSGVKLTSIGYEQDRPFNDIFDGEEHIISNFTAYPNNGVTGLFGKIGSNGIIKNLHLTHCAALDISTSSSVGVGLIAASLSGILLNCSVTDGNITVTEEIYRTGALVGNAYSGSKIINSYVYKTTISSKGYLGCLVGAIENGEIINSFSASNKSIGNSKNESGGFCGKATQSNIINCYNYNLSFTDSNINGMVIGLGESSSINYHYSDSRSPQLIRIDKGCTKENYVFFDISTENISTILCNRLNQWITENQSSYDFTFTRWKEDETGTLPAIFQ